MQDRGRSQRVDNGDKRRGADQSGAKDRQSGTEVCEVTWSANQRPGEESEPVGCRTSRWESEHGCGAIGLGSNYSNRGQCERTDESVARGAGICSRILLQQRLQRRTGRKRQGWSRHKGFGDWAALRTETTDNSKSFEGCDEDKRSATSGTQRNHRSAQEPSYKRPGADGVS